MAVMLLLRGFVSLTLFWLDQMTRYYMGEMNLETQCTNEITNVFLLSFRVWINVATQC